MEQLQGYLCVGLHFAVKKGVWTWVILQGIHVSWAKLLTPFTSPQHQQRRSRGISGCYQIYDYGGPEAICLKAL